jgi:hypothetical protein
VNVNVVVEDFDGGVFEIREFQWGRAAGAGQGRPGAGSAEQFRSNKNVSFVDELAVEECPQQRAPSFDQHVRHPPPAQFGQKDNRIGLTRISRG